eukprot:COSAG03_NODE_2686_length_2525_cov_4.715169_2_plen_65_part_00
MEKALHERPIKRLRDTFRRVQVENSNACVATLLVKKDKGALVLFHAQLGPFQVSMARFYGIRAK